MKRKSDLTGQRSYKLVAIRDTGRRTSSRNAIWECLCDCGNTRFVDTGHWGGKSAKSCGCFLKTQFQCTADGCDSEAHSHGYCYKHLRRFKAHGNLKVSATGTSFDIHERFAAKTVRTADGCLEWTGQTSHTGYGQTTYQGKSHNTHRLAWQLKFGAIPSGLFVCHKCDNRKCVDTDHLFLGTQKENIHDAIAKGRFDPTRIGKLNQQRASR